MIEHVKKVFTYTIDEGKIRVLPAVEATNYFHESLNSDEAKRKLNLNDVTFTLTGGDKTEQLLQYLQYEGTPDENETRDLSVVCAIVEAYERGFSIQDIIEHLANTYYTSLDELHLELFRIAIKRQARMFASKSFNSEDDGHVKHYIVQMMMYDFANMIVRASKSHHSYDKSSFSPKAENIFVRNHEWLRYIIYNYPNL